MTPLDALWHLLNAVAAPFGLALLSAVAVKLLWRQAAAGFSVLSLLIWAYAAAVSGHVAAWAWTGAEGSMTGYGLMVAATAVALWLRLFIVTKR